MSMFRRRLLIHQKTIKKEYIKFADPEVERICIENWSSDGIGLTIEDAEKVTTLNVKFARTDIQTFNEFEYFTGLTVLNGRGDYSIDFFTSCSLLTNIKFPTSLVKIADGDKSYGGGNAGFCNCVSLKEIDLRNITYIGNACFYGCTSLTSVIGQPLYIGANSFENSALTSIDLSKVEIIKLAAFKRCKSLTIDLNLINLQSTDLYTDTFSFTKIKRIISLNKLVSLKDGQGGYYNEYGVFYGCSELEYVNLPDTINYIGHHAFRECTKLRTILINSIIPPSLGLYSFLKTSSDLKIYVPDESVEAYKTATGWIDYADRIHPLSEYVEQ